ncbi:hypothetical protein A1D29_10630 [Pasteurellaceae bacterium Orientalotternb1]|nr:hypothetical protein A1D29_06585 [Pasteurellaceae bacterium Orientalotternb1]QIM63710.1 hypothetical protein A1D29_10630 [Pasteurellaceae bacterium Orientalotternb1]
MSKNKETYYYGQGKVYLSKRDSAGNPVDLRWVGDVSELTATLNVESLSHKESYSGQRTTARKLVIGTEGEVSAKFHEMSHENLALLLRGNTKEVDSGSVSGEKLPRNITADQRIALVHQNVSNVTIDTLTEGEDFSVDNVFGVVTFLKPQSDFEQTISYNYGKVTNTTMLTEQAEDLFLRYEGINLAENNQYQLVELYKVNFEPASALALINTENSLAALDAKAAILADNTKASDDTLGRFGRVVTINAEM